MLAAYHASLNVKNGKGDHAQSVTQLKTTKERFTVNNLLQFFNYTHLPEHLQVVSVLFHEMALHLDEKLPNNAEKTTALRKLLEAKDCAVRAIVFKETAKS